MSSCEYKAPDYDVIHASDFRFPGGTSGSNYHEILAQSRHGLKSGIIQVNSPGLDRRSRQRAVNEKITSLVESGRAEWVRPGWRVTTRTLVFRHPKVLARGTKLPMLTPERVVVVVNHPPKGVDQRLEYDLVDALNRLRNCYGIEPEVRPISPMLDKSLWESFQDSLNIAGYWYNILPVTEPHSTHSRGAASNPLIIGRHSRPGREKWPESAETIKDVYFVGEDRDVRILGGDKVPRNILGFRPANWTVYGFNEIGVDAFLSGIDIFVYFHHSQWVESFGRTIIEALSKGLPVILHKDMAPLYGDVAFCVYPHEVRDVVLRLEADVDLYNEVSRKSREFVETRSSYSSHIERVTHPGEPDKAPRALQPSVVQKTRPDRVRRYVKSLAQKQRGEVVLWVDPAALRFVRAAGEWPARLKWWPFFVLGGNWDLGGSERELPGMQLMRELFLDGVPYTETSRYLEMCAELKAHGETRAPKLHSDEEVHGYFQKLYRLHEKISAEGFLSQVELNGSIRDEITVRIDRHGRLLKCGGGDHRLALARLLGIRKIPVAIDLVHRRWFDRVADQYMADPEVSIWYGLSEYGRIQP